MLPGRDGLLSAHRVSWREPEARMSASSLAIIVVGLGEVAQTHLRVLEQIHNVEVVAGVDPAGSSAATFRGRGLPVYRTVQDAGAEHNPDVAVVATPTATHAAVCSQVTESFPSA